MKLSIIIVNYNTKTLLKACLNSFVWMLSKDQEVIVVDNGSVDGSVEMLKKKFPQIKLIQNGDNKGFAIANNQGIKLAKGKYIWLLNSDTVVKGTTIDTLVGFLDNHPKVGVISPTLFYPDGTIQPTGGSLPRLTNIAAWMWFIDDLPGFKQFFWSYQHRNIDSFTKTHQVGWVGGTAMMIRRSILEKTGLLDEKIFMYAEDVDFCYRVKKHGYQVYLVADTSITHLGQGSGSSIKSILGEFGGLWYVFKKHKPAWEIPIFWVLLKSGILLRFVIFSRIVKNDTKAKAYQQALSLVG